MAAALKVAKAATSRELQADADAIKGDLDRLAVEIEAGLQALQAMNGERVPLVDAWHVRRDGEARKALAELDARIAAAKAEAEDRRGAEQRLRERHTAALRAVRAAARREANAAVAKIGAERDRTMARIGERAAEIAELMVLANSQTTAVLQVTGYRPQDWHPLSRFRLPQDIREALARALPTVFPGEASAAASDPLARQAGAWREALLDPEG